MVKCLSFQFFTFAILKSFKRITVLQKLKFPPHYEVHDQTSNLENNYWNNLLPFSRISAIAYDNVELGMNILQNGFKGTTV